MIDTNKKLNFVFWGTPDVAHDTLEILKINGYVPSLIITSTDKAQGRKMLITPPPVKTWAIENNIPYLQPENLTDFSPANLGGNIDLSIVVAYGKIIPEKILNLPNKGSINIHYSLLPKYRGASPVESAILNGEAETGISIQQMQFKMDAGPILAQEIVEIGMNEKAQELRARLIKIGGELLVKILPEIIENKIKPIAQDEINATYCKKIKKEDGLLDLVHDVPDVLYNKYKAYASWPRTYFFENGKRVIITEAALVEIDENHNKEFVIKKVIPEGKKEISFKEYKRITSANS